MITLNHRRKDPGKFYAYPEHGSIWQRLLWHCGFDHLTLRERLDQVDFEREYWRYNHLTSSELED